MLDNFYVGNSEWSQILIEMLDVDKNKIKLRINLECQYVLLRSTSTSVHVVVRMV